MLLKTDDELHIEETGSLVLIRPNVVHAKRNLGGCQFDHPPRKILSVNGAAVLVKLRCECSGPKTDIQNDGIRLVTSNDRTADLPAFCASRPVLIFSPEKKFCRTHRP